MTAVTIASLGAVTVTSLSLSALGLAFVAGLLSFISPCVLPLLPVYLSFISGVGVEQLAGHRRRLLWTALLFVAGFTLVFMLMGAGAGGVGHVLVRYRRELTIAAGAFIAFSGLVVAGVVPLPKPVMRVSPTRRGAGGAFVTGTALAVGWTPCVGYVLGAILGPSKTDAILGVDSDAVLASTISAQRLQAVARRAPEISEGRRAVEQLQLALGRRAERAEPRRRFALIEGRGQLASERPDHTSTVTHPR